MATPSKCPCCTDTLNAAGMELKFPFGAKFRQGKDKKRRSVAWNEMGSLEGSQPIFFPTQNSTGLYLNFFKTDIFMEFSNRLFLTSPLIPQAFPPSTSRVCQILPCQLQLYCTRSWALPEVLDAQLYVHLKSLHMGTHLIEMDICIFIPVQFP